MSNFNYTLIRSKRKSICITIKNGNIEVKAPLRTSIEEVEKFLFQKEKWISNKIKTFNERFVKNRHLINYEEISILGKNLKVTKDINAKIISITSESILLPVKLNLWGSNQDKDIAISKLSQKIKREAYKYLNYMLNFYSSQLNISYTSFKLTNSKVKWGSCDGHNNITLNWRLYMLDEELIKYVILHELCHTCNHNHSKKFWESLQTLFPGYKKYKAMLKEQSIFISLLR